MCAIWIRRGPHGFLIGSGILINCAEQLCVVHVTEGQKPWECLNLRDLPFNLVVNVTN